MQISDIKPYSKDIILQFMVIKSIDSVKTKDDQIVHTYLISDPSGSIEYSIFDQKLDIGDIMLISHAYVTYFKGKLRLFNSEISQIQRIGEFEMNFCICPNLSETMK